MSSIIDDLIFYQQIAHSTAENKSEYSLRDLEELSKNFIISQGATLLSSTSTKYEVLNKLRLKNHDFSFRMLVQDKLKSARVEARLLQAYQYKRISSKHNQILLLKEIAKRQEQANCYYSFCIIKGCLVMVQKIYFFLIDPMHQKKAIDFYNATSTKNLQQFQQFVSLKVSCISKLSSNICDIKNLIQEDLFLSQCFCTSSINFNIAQDQTKFSLMQEASNKQQIQIKNVINHLQQSTNIEDSTRSLLLMVPPQLGEKWLRQNLEFKFGDKFKIFSTLLGIARFFGEKKIDDFIFNTVKITVKETISKPLGEGGSCQVFLAKAEIIFINSTDNTSYSKTDEKKEKFIAIKKLKPQFSRMRYKLDHEKTIVSKLKGGVSYFLPRYYKVQDKLDEGDTVLMEYINGEELNYFISCRQETMSLWTKVCVLANVVSGMRHLSAYSITHLDLKPVNIIVCKNHHLLTKIIDFGQAHHPQVCNQNYSPGYTFPYVAPQIFRNYNKEGCQEQDDIQISQKQDVFAFGCIMFQVLFNQKIFHYTQARYQEIYRSKQILERLFLAYQKVEDYGDYMAVSSIIHLIIRCLDQKPQKRPTFNWIGIMLRLILNSRAGAT